MRAVARLSPARNPLAYHSDYFGACAVGANGAPRPFLRCRAADETPGVKRRAGGGVSRARGLDSTGQAQKKRSRPGNCARRRRLLKALKATPAPAFYLLVSYRPLAFVGPARRRGVFRAILRQPQRRMYAVSGAGEAEEHAIFAGRLLSACGACSTTHAVHRCVRAVKLQPKRGWRELTR